MCGKIISGGYPKLHSGRLRQAQAHPIPNPGLEIIHRLRASPSFRSPPRWFRTRRLEEEQGGTTEEKSAILLMASSFFTLRKNELEIDGCYINFLHRHARCSIRKPWRFPLEPQFSRKPTSPFGRQEKSKTSKAERLPPPPALALAQPMATGMVLADPSVSCC